MAGYIHDIHGDIFIIALEQVKAVTCELITGPIMPQKLGAIDIDRLVR